MGDRSDALAIVAAMLPLNPQIISPVVKRNEPVTGKLPFFENLADRLSEFVHGRTGDSELGPLGLRSWLQRSYGHGRSPRQSGQRGRGQVAGKRIETSRNWTACPDAL
jgi:hypothetical protein